MLHWSLVRLAHCLLVIALNYVYYFEQNKYDDMMILIEVTLRMSGNASGYLRCRFSQKVLNRLGSVELQIICDGPLCDII